MRSTPGGAVQSVTRGRITRLLLIEGLPLAMIATVIGVWGATALFRILQESFTNVARHSKAT